MSATRSSCENCGTDFESTGELTGSRILCPTCAAERRAQLEAARAARAAGARVPTRATAPAVAGSPATRMAAPAAAARSRPARPTERAPARQRTQGNRGDHRHAGVLDIPGAGGRSMARMGWLAVGTLALVTGLVLVFVMNKHESDAQAGRDHEKRLNEIVVTIRAFQLDQEGQAQAALDYIASTQGEWKHQRIENEVSGLRTVAMQAIQRNREKKHVDDVLGGIESRLAGSPSLETLREQFNAIRDQALAAKFNEVGGEYHTRYDHLVQTVTERYLSALKGSLAGAASATTREGLAAYGLYE